MLFHSGHFRLSPPESRAGDDLDLAWMAGLSVPCSIITRCNRGSARSRSLSQYAELGDGWTVRFRVGRAHRAVWHSGRCWNTRLGRGGCRAAWARARNHSADFHPDKTLSSFALGNTFRFQPPVWYLMWGDKKSGYVAFIDANSGKVLKQK